MAAITSTELAKTTARVKCARMGTVRMGFRPRQTTAHVPGTSVYVALIARYHIYGREPLQELPASTYTQVLS